MFLLYPECAFPLYHSFQVQNFFAAFRMQFIYLFIYLFLAVLGLRCCARAFSSCGERGLLFIAVHRLLIAVASLVGSMGSRRMGFSSCGTWASVVVARGL